MQAARRATRLLFRPEQAQGGGVVLTTYGRASGFCIDPIEKKPLNHFYPGTSVLSFGTAGCSLGCRFWQNWDISKARAINRVSDWASPEQVAEAAGRIGCRSIAFTYNDPVIFAEYRLTPRRRPRGSGDGDGCRFSSGVEDRVSPRTGGGSTVLWPTPSWARNWLRSESSCSCSESPCTVSPTSFCRQDGRFEHQGELVLDHKGEEFTLMIRSSCAPF